MVLGVRLASAPASGIECAVLLHRTLDAERQRILVVREDVDTFASSRNRYVPLLVSDEIPLTRIDMNKGSVSGRALCGMSGDRPGMVPVTLGFEVEGLFNDAHLRVHGNERCRAVVGDRHDLRLVSVAPAQVVCVARPADAVTRREAPLFLPVDFSVDVAVRGPGNFSSVFVLQDNFIGRQLGFDNPPS